MVLVDLDEVVNIEQASYVARKKTKSTIPSLKSEFKESVRVEHCSSAILRRVLDPQNYIGRNSENSPHLGFRWLIPAV